MTFKIKRHPMHFMGYGPWLVRDDCGSKTHNTYSAVLKSAGINNPRCICPRALAIKAEVAVKKQANKLASVRGKSIPSYVRQVKPDTVVPDLSKGRCMTQGGRAVMDGAGVRGVGQGERVAAAKWMCIELCAVRFECLAWVTLAEEPAGSWGGIYGGLDANERKMTGAVVGA